MSFLRSFFLNFFLFSFFIFFLYLFSSVPQILLTNSHLPTWLHRHSICLFLSNFICLLGFIFIFQSVVFYSCFNTLRPNMRPNTRM